MRQKSAITGEFKPQTGGPFFVVELEVKQPLPSNIGFVGPQVNKEKLPDGTILNLNTNLVGGGTQAEFLIPPSQRIEFLTPISAPTLLEP